MQIDTEAMTIGEVKTDGYASREFIILSTYDLLAQTR